MKNILVITLFMLAMLAWAAAQQPLSAPERNSGQTASPSSQAPSGSQTQPSKPGGADQGAARGQESQAPITEGCLGGSAPNYTITDNNGTVYKLNMPPNTDTSKLAQHVGESVQVQGDVKDAGKTGNASINVQAIGRGTGNCPASGPKNTPPPPKQ
jgi:cytoskeletal protein RodZ